MIASRKLTLIAAAILAAVVISCGSEQAPGASSTESPATATSTSAPAAFSPTPTLTPTEPPATQAASSPSAVPSPTSSPEFQPEFVDNADCQNVSRDPLPLADLLISDGERWVAFAAETAVTQAEQSQGLMCRATVPDGTGMLFTFDQERGGGFWMFNTYVPLDIIFFGAADGSIASVQMEPCPRRDGEADSVWSQRCGEESADYRHGITYTYALELRQGWLESQGFNTADPWSLDITVTPRD